MRKRIDEFFGDFARLIYRNAIKTLLVMLALVGILFSQIPKLEFDTSTEGFLHEKDPTLLAYNAFREQFGRDEWLIIGIGPTDVFDLAFLRKLDAFHEELEASVPYLDEVDSLINARNTRGEGDELIVGDLLEELPTNKNQLPALRELVFANSLYRNMLISEDGRFTTVIVRTLAYSQADQAGEGEGVDTDFDERFEGSPSGEKTSTSEHRPFLTDAENGEIVHAVRKVIEKFNRPDFPLHLAGSPVVTEDVKRSMQHDMPRFTGLAIVGIAFFLFFMFRRISGVISPLLIVILSLGSTLGLMAIFKIPFKIPTQILPSFLLAVGVGDSVHILSIFYQQLHKGKNKEEAIVESLRHCGMAVLMTSLTTAAGLGSFATAQVAPIADLGRVAALGVMLALFYTLIFLPALIAVLPIRIRTDERTRTENAWMDRLLGGIATYATRRAKPILAFSSVFIVACLVATSFLRFSHDPLAWLPKTSPTRIATELIDRELRGSITLEVLTDTGKENGLTDPTLLHKLDAFAQDIQTIDHGDLFVGKTMGLTDILKEIHQALHGNDPSYHVVPDNHNLIAQELLLFENSGSDDLEDITNSQFSLGRTTLKVPWINANRYAVFIGEIDGRYHRIFGQEQKPIITGLLPVLARTVNAAMHSAIMSYAIAGVVITIMMILLVGRLGLGLASMLPNLLPIFLMTAVMQIFGLPLDMFNMLVASIAIGLAVDDTIHFMQNFQREYRETGDIEGAIRHTLQTTGRAMLATSAVLSLGFFIYMISDMNNLFSFGLLTGLAIITALLADLFVAPALVTIIEGRKKRREK